VTADPVCAAAKALVTADEMFDGATGKTGGVY
jgi:hypothetical protein